jgi:hypothetical protein
MDRPRWLFNAENLTFTSDGRLFASGSKAIYEIDFKDEIELKHQDSRFKKAQPREIPITVASLPADYMRNGLATDDAYLYVACASADQGSSPIARWWPSLPEIEQTLIGSTLVFAIVGMCHCRSWIVRARLDKNPLVFDEAIALPGDYFANGIAVDQTTKSVYVACSASKDILRVGIDGGDMSFAEKIVLRNAEGSPNGVKVRDGTLYCTTSNIVPPISGCVYRVGQPIAAPGASELEPRFVQPDRCYRRYAFFDDFDCVGNGFVVAAPSDLARPSDYVPPFSGALFFVGHGTCFGSYRHSLLKYPSAVRVVNGERIPDTQPGDMFITEKHNHALYLFRPDAALRHWVLKQI